jgi:hypothetical protein
MTRCVQTFDWYCISASYNTKSYLKDGMYTVRSILCAVIDVAILSNSTCKIKARKRDETVFVMVRWFYPGLTHHTVSQTN